MENKTKEQLGDDYISNNSTDISIYPRLTLVRKCIELGYDSRQPEIDRLKSIISGKTFHDETEVLKAEIDALTKISEEMAKDLIEQSAFFDGSLESVAKFYNYKQAINPPKQTKP